MTLLPVALSDSAAPAGSAIAGRRERYGLDGEELSIRQIAERLGPSTSRVRDIERRALRNLRQAAVAAGAAR